MKGNVTTRTVALNVATILLPTVPRYFVLADHLPFKTTPTQEYTAAELRKVGEAWTVALIQAAAVPREEP